MRSSFVFLVLLVGCGGRTDLGIDPEPPGAVTLVGYLVADCAWQAYPKFTAAGQTYWLDTFLSDVRPTRGPAPVCAAAPLTSAALLQPLAPPVDAHRRYRLDGSYAEVELCWPTTMGGPVACRPGPVFIPTSLSELP